MSAAFPGTEAGVLGPYWFSRGAESIGSPGTLNPLKSTTLIKEFQVFPEKLLPSAAPGLELNPSMFGA